MFKKLLLSLLCFSESAYVLAEDTAQSKPSPTPISIAKLQQQRIAIHEKLFSAAQQAYKVGQLNQVRLDSKEIELLQVKLNYETQSTKRIEMLTRIAKLEKAKLALIERDYSLGIAQLEDKLQQESRVLHAEIELRTQQEK